MVALTHTLLSFAFDARTFRNPMVEHLIEKSPKEDEEEGEGAWEEEEEDEEEKLMKRKKQKEETTNKRVDSKSNEALYKRNRGNMWRRWKESRGIAPKES